MTSHDYATPLTKSTPKPYHLSLHMHLDGFLRKYLSSWVLTHVIGANDDPPIPNLGKLYELYDLLWRLNTMLSVIYLMAFTYDTTHFLCCIGLVYMPPNWWLQWVAWAPLCKMYFARIWTLVLWRTLRRLPTCLIEVISLIKEVFGLFLGHHTL